MALLCGNYAVILLHLPLPGSVTGLIILVILLITGVVKVEWIDKAASFLLKHLTLMFIPLVIGVFMSPALKGIFTWNVILVLILSSLCCLLGTAISVEGFEKLKRRKKG
ncbi:CidA/LrgA family protein [Peribacillus sp. SCS-155]|uniref:CidA/LrgA family protein n=1 Tax=Peribacillus sedimenti TaxID=3115297 RepID=UPI003906824C